MKLLTTVATLAALLVSAGTAMAVPVTSGTPVTTPNGGHHGQYYSNSSIKAARRHIERAIDRLQSDAWDYGGHKEAAMDDLGVARQFLEQGLAWEQSHNGNKGNNSSAGGGVLPNGNFGSGTTGGVIPIDNHQGGPGTGNGPGVGSGNGGGQQGSNENIQFVRGHIEAAISVLQSDSSDYGGYKERAIDNLQKADNEMAAAVNFVHRPGVQNGSKNPQISDANLSYVKEHVMTAISRLQSDSHDYGGHRVDAVNDLNQANAFLGEALSYDQSHDHYNNTSTGAVIPNGANGSTFGHPAATGGTFGHPATAGGQAVGGSTMGGMSTLGQQESNDSLTAARQHLETAIDALQRDTHDYGGFRVKAMDAMQAARTQILDALQYRSQHGMS